MIHLIFFWVLYFTLHSLLASMRIKMWVKTKLPVLFKYYRLMYNIFASVSLALILQFQGQLPAHSIATLPEWVALIGYGFIGIGMVLMGLALKNYDLQEFAGLKPMNEFLPSGSALKTNGLNAYVRHPICLSFIILILGYLLISFNDKTLAFFIIVLIYLFIGAKLEEQKLILLYGEHYIKYKQKVPMFIPLFRY